MDDGNIDGTKKPKILPRVLSWSKYTEDADSYSISGETKAAAKESRAARQSAAERESDGVIAEDNAAAWLRANDHDSSYDNDDILDNDTTNPLVGMGTAADIQLARFQNTEPRIQAGIIAAVNGTLSGVDEIDRAAAVEQFGVEIGGDPVAFVKRLKVDASVENPRHSHDLRTVISMLGTTSGEYMDKGPGANLAGHTLVGDRRNKQEEELAKAIGFISDLSGLYVHDKTIGSTVEPSRRKAIQQSLTARFMDGTSYIDSESIMPMPNELYHNGTDGRRVVGTVVTQGVIPTRLGTALNRLEGGNIEGNEKSDLRQIPNLANSLHPQKYEKGVDYTQEQKDKLKRDQAHAMDQTMFKAKFIRRVVLEQLPTNRDESAQQGRLAGFDRPYDEQDRQQNLLNEASYQDLDWTSGDDTSALSIEEEALYGKGSDRAGMHGHRLLSEVDLFVEEANDARAEEGNTYASPNGTAPTGSDRESYLAKLSISKPPKQGSPEWLAQRKGHITASAVTGWGESKALTAEGGPEERALELALEKVGKGKKYVGNSHTKDGNDGEPDVLAAFLAGPGKDLDFEEAFFEPGKDNGMPGWGVSPDGRLYNQKTGASEGLLELKDLSETKGSSKKYNDQMQTQMMVTGETKTHFYALNKYTGEFEYSTVHADPERQTVIKEAGDMALAMSSGLDARGIKALRDNNEKPEARKPADAQGQTKAFEQVGEVTAEAMTAFGDEATSGEASQAQPSLPRSNKSRAIFEKDERSAYKENRSRAKKAATEIQSAGKKELAAYAEDRARAAKTEDEIQSTGKRESAAYKEDEARASKKATESLQSFNKAVSTATGVLKKIGSIVRTGNDSAIEEKRQSDDMGIDVRNHRAIKKALEDGHLSKAGISKVLGTTADTVNAFRNPLTGGIPRFMEIQEGLGGALFDEVRGLRRPDYAEFSQMDGQEYLTYAAENIEAIDRSDLSAGDKKLAKNQSNKALLGGTEFSTYDQGSVRMRNAYADEMSKEDILAAHTVLVNKDQLVRHGEELATNKLGTGGGFMGAASEVLGTVADVVMSVGGAGYLGKKFLGKSPKASNFLNKAKSLTPKAANLSKLANAAKFSPMGLAYGAVPIAARHAIGIEDDGGLGDSAMDVLEAAGIGATIGSFVPIPGVGTGVGAVIGAGVGVANELWEWASDDAIPEESIGNLPAPNSKASSGNMTNNVDVNVEINGGEYKVETNVNGEELLDEGSGVPT